MSIVPYEKPNQITIRRPSGKVYHKYLPDNRVLIKRVRFSRNQQDTIDSLRAELTLKEQEHIKLEKSLKDYQTSLDSLTDEYIKLKEDFTISANYQRVKHLEGILKQLSFHCPQQFKEITILQCSYRIQHNKCNCEILKNFLQRKNLV